MFVPCLAHKLNNKLLFCLCRSCAKNGSIQCKPCSHSVEQRAWIDVYTSIDIERALLVGYQILEYHEVWHYHGGEQMMFNDFILNIVDRKIECSEFPPSCSTREDKLSYMDDVEKNCGIKLDITNIRKDPAGRTLNESMANSIWGKWAQNPAGQSSLKTCSTLKQYHDSLMTGRVKQVALVSDNILQVEMNNDRNIDGENREVHNNGSGLGGQNTMIGAFVTAAARDLMYSHFLSKLATDQLLYTDTDSVVYFYDSKNPLHVELSTSDMPGDLKDEYEELLLNNPNWYVKEFIAFGPKCTK